MYFELYQHGKLKVRGSEIYELSVTYKLNAMPTCNVSIGAEYLKYTLFKSEMKIYDEVNGKSLYFHGYIQGSQIDKETETLQITIVDVMDEWDKENIPVNVTKKDSDIEKIYIYGGTDFKPRLHDWDILIDYKTDKRDDFEYEFSRETKLEGLDKVCGLTESISWLRPRNTDRVLKLSEFGDKKNYIVSDQNIVDQFQVESDGSNIINMVVPLSDKSDSGSTSVTLRDVYNDKSLQLAEFPVILTGNTINDQASQIGFLYPEYAPNNVKEYAVLDVVGISMEDGDIYEGSFASNDITPVQTDGKKISNADRIKASKTLYKKAVRKLKESRRLTTFSVSVVDLPVYVNPGDKVKFIFNNFISDFRDACTPYCREVMYVDDWFYVLSIEISYEETGVPVYSLKLSKTLQSELNNREV